MATAESIEVARNVGLTADTGAVASGERGSTPLRGMVIAIIGGAVLLLLGGGYFATQAGSDYPEPAPIFGD